jgi:hypothetical protein
MIMSVDYSDNENLYKRLENKKLTLKSSAGTSGYKYQYKSSARLTKLIKEIKEESKKFINQNLTNRS